jgi:serine/threonine protein kinase
LQDKKQVFAVKEFREHRSIKDDFHREQSMLHELRRYPHNHIVVHLTSWIQEDKYYLLFPYASCNLREYMKRNPKPTLNKKFVVWILRQFRGLADAVRNVHNLREYSPRSQNASLDVPKQPGFQQGYHHDIKPENILFFEGKVPEDARLKLADFGLGKVHNLRSGSRFKDSRKTGLTGAFPTYEAPEGYLKKAISRPSDMWALGCVFLEMLVWIFVPTEPAEEAFVQARSEVAFPHVVQILDDAFWRFNRDLTGAVLRPGVLKWIGRVESLSQGKRAFQRILECVKELLNPNSETRLKAVELYDRCDAIVKQAKRDLEETPNLYVQNDLAFPSETMLPSRTAPTTPDMQPSQSSGSQPLLPALLLPETSTAGDSWLQMSSTLVSSPQEDSSLQTPGLFRQPSSGANLSPNTYLSETRSRDHSISSNISFLSNATHGSGSAVESPDDDQPREFLDGRRTSYDDYPGLQNQANGQTSLTHHPEPQPQASEQTNPVDHPESLPQTDGQMSNDDNLGQRHHEGQTNHNDNPGTQSQASGRASIVNHLLVQPRIDGQMSYEDNAMQQLHMNGQASLKN